MAQILEPKANSLHDKFFKSSHLKTHLLSAQQSWPANCPTATVPVTACRSHHPGLPGGAQAGGQESSDQGRARKAPWTESGVATVCPLCPESPQARSQVLGVWNPLFGGRAEFRDQAPACLEEHALVPRLE